METNSLTTHIWCVPSNLESKDPFPELTFILEYIKSEQLLAKQIDDTLATIEKCYKSFSLSSPKRI